jgi:hypothetical protein
MIIARRLLRLVGKDAEDKFIEIRIISPERRAESWWCDYEIDWPAGQWKSAGAGIDAIQAMRLHSRRSGPKSIQAPIIDQAA